MEASEAWATYRALPYRERRFVDFIWLYPRLHRFFQFGRRSELEERMEQIAAALEEDEKRIGRERYARW
jgi:hypothetical protein